MKNKNNCDICKKQVAYNIKDIEPNTKICVGNLCDTCLLGLDYFNRDEVLLDNAKIYLDKAFKYVIEKSNKCL